MRKPLFSLSTQWGWSVSASGTSQIGRVFEGSQIRTFDDPDSTEVEELPFIFRAQSFGATASVVRSFGSAIKQNLSVGYGIGGTSYEFGEDDGHASEFDEALVSTWEDAFLPRTELVSKVLLGYHVFTPDYLQLRNFETFALPEDFRLGPSLQIELGHADPAIGSDERFESLGSTYVHRWSLFAPEGDLPSREADVVVLKLAYNTRLQGGELLDNEVSLSLQNYTPVYFRGRLVWRGVGIYRFEDLSNRISTLGGGAGLRGYASGQFLARSMARSNLEWRTLPTEFWTFHLGMALFYDVAAIADQEDLSDLAAYHSVGMGFRWLNPASNRVVMRFDYGFPLGGPVATLPGNFSFGFEQAF